MFCHWLVAVKKYPLRDVDYWKVAQREHLWERNTEGGYISIGLDELGDLTDCSKADFEQRRDAFIEKHPDQSKQGANQIWRFSRIREGDRVVLNRGWNELLGVATVTGLRMARRAQLT